MSNLISTKEFRELYKNNSFLYRKLLREKLLTVAKGEFSNNKVYIARNYLYFTFIQCNVDIDLVIDSYLENGYSFIYNEDEPYFGGFEWVKIDFTKYVRTLDINEKTDDVLSEQFHSQFIHLEQEYWRENPLIDIVNKYVNNIEQKDKLSFRDQFLSSTSISVNGVPLDYKPIFYNKKTVRKMYENLIELFFTGFDFNKNLSKGKINRYSKKIDKDYSLSIMVNFANIDANLSTQNFVLLKLNVELHSNNLIHISNKNVYSIKDNEYSIVLIEPYNFLWKGSPIINFVPMDNEKLIKNTIMYFDFYCQEFKTHLEFIETNIIKTLEDPACVSMPKDER